MDVTTLPETHPSLSFTYARTLDRRLVNRRSVAEVFITDFHPVSDVEWIVGAQLPLGHAYYSDHVAMPMRYDPLLILECCRQAGTYGGYAQFGIPLGTVNMVSSLVLSIDPAKLHARTDRPGHLVIHVLATDIVQVGARTRSAKPRMTLYLDGKRLGNAAIPVNLASPEQFSALRSRMRQGPPAFTHDMEEPSEPVVDPLHVGRRRELNVLIAGARRTADGESATLRLSPLNTSILDHDHDHIPAMALADSAVQLATWGTGIQRHAISSLEAKFTRFTEVDSPAHLDGGLIAEKQYRVIFEQNDVCTGSIDLAFR